MENKANIERKQQRDLRLREVMVMLVAGKYRWEIIRDLGQKWDVSEHTIDGYIKDSKKLMVEHYSDETIEDIMSKYNYLYQCALKTGDMRLAVKILDSISKVGGYYKEKVDITTNGESMNQTIINIINPNGDNSNTK
jgi:hypothetical protein